MIVYISRVTNPYLNLAMENFIFRKSKEERILLLYKNEPCVVIGRNQNPLVECNLKHLQIKEIPVIRRYSGGGTVYHDLGNLNYSLMTPKVEFQRSKGVTFLQEALRIGNVETMVSERNDLLIQKGSDIKKISGSAFKLASHKCYHHGTLLCTSNLCDLKTGLQAADIQIDNSAVTSVPMSVANINISIEFVTKLILKFVNDTYSKGLCKKLLDTEDAVKDIIYLNKSDFLNPDIEENLEELHSFSWTFEKTPKFIQKFNINGDQTVIEVRNLSIVWSNVTKLKGTSYLDLYTNCNVQHKAFSEMLECLNKYKYK
eukprot:NODE_675_length_5306_cov_0.405224.p3 type:complete len:315 gc:universal NODE_675_length_5306_cov_0.405224:464-1408(+)